VRDGLRDTGLRLIVDGGECEIGVESTIVDLTEPERPRLLRPGGLAVEEVERILGRAVLRPVARGGVVATGVAAPAPGMLAQHYSPRTALTLRERLTPAFVQALGAREAVLLLRRPDEARTGRGKKRDARIHWLSEAGELDEIARNLFARLRELDTGGWERIYAEAPEGAGGLAPAIRDRLTRAAAQGGDAENLEIRRFGKAETQKR
jgi:L-threonylcarbamoyladenylate synthase